MQRLPFQRSAAAQLLRHTTPPRTTDTTTMYYAPPYTPDTTSNTRATHNSNRRPCGQQLKGHACPLSPNTHRPFSPMCPEEAQQLARAVAESLEIVMPPGHSSQMNDGLGFTPSIDGSLKAVLSAHEVKVVENDEHKRIREEEDLLFGNDPHRPPVKKSTPSPPYMCGGMVDMFTSKMVEDQQNKVDAYRREVQSLRGVLTSVLTCLSDVTRQPPSHYARVHTHHSSMAPQEMAREAHRMLALLCVDAHTHHVHGGHTSSSPSSSRTSSRASSPTAPSSFVTHTHTHTHRAHTHTLLPPPLSSINLQGHTPHAPPPPLPCCMHGPHTCTQADDMHTQLIKTQAELDRAHKKIKSLRNALSQSTSVDVGGGGGGYRKEGVSSGDKGWVGGMLVTSVTEIYGGVGGVGGFVGVSGGVPKEAHTHNRVGATGTHIGGVGVSGDGSDIHTRVLITDTQTNATHSAAQESMITSGSGVCGGGSSSDAGGAIGCVNVRSGQRAVNEVPMQTQQRTWRVCIEVGTQTLETEVQGETLVVEGEGADGWVECGVRVLKRGLDAVRDVGVRVWGFVWGYDDDTDSRKVVGEGLLADGSESDGDAVTKMEEGMMEGAPAA